MSAYTPTVTGTGPRAAVQRFGAFLAGMIMPNLGAFIAWGLLTAVTIQNGWINLIARAVGADMRERELRSRLLLQVHDELVLEVAEGEADDLGEIVERRMREAAQLRVPLEVQVGTGHDWDAAAH